MINVGDLNKRVRSFLLRKMEPEQISLISASDFTDVYNTVCDDLNREAVVNVERYNVETDTTNINLVSNVVSVLSFRFYGTSVGTQKFVIVDDYIILKVDPGGALCDIKYLRQPRHVTTSLTDEFDLPNYAENELIELIKIKCLTEFANAEPEVYLEYLKLRGRQLAGVKRLKGSGGVRKYWLGRTGDGNKYEIRDTESGQENIFRDALGVWHWNDE